MESTQPHSGTALWEKLVGLAGLLLVCFMIGFLLWSAARDEADPPDFGFTVRETIDQDTRFLVLLEIRNDGELTVADLHIEAQLRNADDEAEISVARIDYLAAGSVRRVGLYFAGDPRAGELSFRPLGYQEP